MNLVSRIVRLEHVAIKGAAIAHWSDEKLIRRSIALHWDLANSFGGNPEYLGVVQSAAAAYGVEIDTVTLADVEHGSPTFVEEVCRCDGMSEADLISHLTAKMRAFSSHVEFFQECARCGLGR